MILLFINLQGSNKENFDHWSFICDKTTSTTQRHVVSMAPKNWKLGGCSDPQELSAFELKNAPEIEETGKILSSRGIRKVNNQEI